MAAIEVERAFRCGARYCVSRWRRRAPPRFRGIRPSRPGYLHALDQQRAFYRGYDAATRALIAHRAAWVEPWLERRVA